MVDAFGYLDSMCMHDLLVNFLVISPPAPQNKCWTHIRTFFLCVQGADVCPAQSPLFRGGIFCCRHPVFPTLTRAIFPIFSSFSSFVRGACPSLFWLSLPLLHDGFIPARCYFQLPAVLLYAPMFLQVPRSTAVDRYYVHGMFVVYDGAFHSSPKSPPKISSAPAGLLLVFRKAAEKIRGSASRQISLCHIAVCNTHVFCIPECRGLH